MIRHVSMSAQNPRRVAETLAEIMDGCCYPSPGWIAGSWMAVSSDGAETMIEVCPAEPSGGDGQAVAGSGQGTKAAAVACRFLLSVSSDAGTIQRIGAREGWVTRLAGRGAPGQEAFFNVLELWVENTVMLELVPEDMMDTYTERLQPPMPDTSFGRTLAAHRPRPVLEAAARRFGGLVDAFFRGAHRHAD